MRLVHLSDGIYTSVITSAEDIAAVAHLGIKSVMDVSPDKRDFKSSVFAEAARSARIDYSCATISCNELSGSALARFCLALTNVRKPVLLFSDDVTWPAVLWALYEARQTEVGYILERLSRIGLDIADDNDFVAKLEGQRHKATWQSINFPITF